MKRRYWKGLAAAAFVLLAIGALFGFSPVELLADVVLNVEWIDGFTGHTDGVLLANAAAAATRTAATGESDGAEPPDATPAGAEPPAETRQVVVQLTDAQLERLLGEPTEAEVQAAMDQIAPAGTGQRHAPELVPPEERSAEAQRTISGGARVIAQRDTDVPEGAYVHTHRMIKAYVSRNFDQMHRIQDHMIRAGWYQYQDADGAERTFATTGTEGDPFLPVVVANRIDAIAEQVGVMESLCTVWDLTSGTLKVPNMPGIIPVAAVGEASPIPGLAVATGNAQGDPQKWGGIASWSNEMNDEVGAQYTTQLVAAVGAGFGKAVDETVLIADGTAAFHNITGLANLAGVPEHVLGAGSTSPQAFGYDDHLAVWDTPAPAVWSGVRAIFHPKMKTVYKGMKDGNGAYLYLPFPGAMVEDTEWTEALPYSTGALVDTVFGVVGEFAYVHITRRQGLEVTLLREGIIKDSGGTDFNLATQHGLALRFVRKWDVDVATEMVTAFGRVKTAAV